MEKNNKLIAEFMDLTIKEGVCYYTDADDMFPMGIEVEAPYIPYDDDWNWLMRVVDKIEDIRFDNEDKDSFVSYHRYDVDNRGIGCAITDVQEGKVVGCGDYATKRESTYNAVVEFIKFYNLKERKDER